MCQTIIMICVMALLLCVKTSAFGIHSRQKRVDATGNSARVRATLKESFTDLFGGGSKTTKDLKTGAVDCEKDPLAMDCVVEEIEEKSSLLDSKYVDVNSNSTLKAEILRLEAERDNLMFAKSRIEIRKKKLENIDTMLQKLVNNQIRFDDVLDMKSEPVSKTRHIKIFLKNVQTFPCCTPILLTKLTANLLQFFTF